MNDMNDVADRQRQGLDPKLKELLEQKPDDEGDLLYCGTCSNVIGRRSDSIAVNGGHEHHCTNPYGISFHIGCFREALGCSISGQPSAADTWFPGFKWRLATCSECQVHLGWYFDRGSEYFYGLILDRIQHE
jgi:hypothetical protein